MMSLSMVFDGISPYKRRKQDQERRAEAQALQRTNHEVRSKDWPLHFQHLNRRGDEFTNVDLNTGAQSFASGLQE